MNTPSTTQESKHSRRRFCGTVAALAAAAQFGVLEGAEERPGAAHAVDAPSIRPGMHKSFASLKQVDAGLLNVAYAEAGPADGPAVILLHGWPYDIHSYVDLPPCWRRRGIG
jgi:hypothetical protein